jgi:3-oxoacyl-[acyl-carrier-protein] synthase II
VDAEGSRVVVTGMGLISPVGLDVPTAWKNVVEGVSGIGPITLFPTDGFRVTIAGEAHGFEPTDYMTPKEARRADRNVQFAVAAAKQAIEQAGLDCPFDGEQAFQAGAVIGSGAGGITTYMAQHAVLNQDGPSRLNPMLVPMIVVDSASVQVSIVAGARGPGFGIASACSTGADAIGLAFETIRRGDAEVMFAGGTEAAITELGIGGFDQLHALSRRNDAPDQASRPFDLGRDGFVLSEGAGVVVLESLAHAEARGAEPLAELLAYAATGDAAHFTAPDATAEPAVHAISLALRKAGVEPAEVDYVNAHATSTPVGDIIEVRALKKALGDAAGRAAISSSKSVAGHMLGAAGAAELIWTVQTIREGIVPPTINLTSPDPECDLDLVPNEARRRDVRVALSNSFGFGGHNTILVLGHPERNGWLPAARPVGSDGRAQKQAGPRAKPATP